VFRNKSTLIHLKCKLKLKFIRSKKMLRYKNLIFVLLFLQSDFGLAEFDLCIQSSNQTAPKACTGKYSYACKHNMCAVNKGNLRLSKYVWPAFFLKY
jgi:hypothetical protein